MERVGFLPFLYARGTIVLLALFVFIILIYSNTSPFFHNSLTKLMCSWQASFWRGVDSTPSQIVKWRLVSSLVMTEVELT